MVLRVELKRTKVEMKIYSIFELKYLHDKSEVFILSNGINKKINQKKRSYTYINRNRVSITSKT